MIRRLWTEETVTFEGEHLHFDGAYCDPKPVQQLPPVLVGGGGEQVNLRIAARHADITNWQVGLEAFVRKSGLLERYCEEVGRPFDAITRTHGPDCRLFDTDAEARAWCDGTRRRRPVGRRRRPISTWPTTWWVRSTRWPRRPRPSSTPAAGGSSCGCATSPATRPCDGSWPKSCQVFTSPEPGPLPEVGTVRSLPG